MGTTSTGRAAVIMFTSTVPTFKFAADNECVCEWWVRVPTLSDGTETYTFWCGLIDTITGLAQSNAACFVYVQTTTASITGDTHWQYYQRNGGAGSAVATTVTVTAGQWYRLTVKKYSGANAWEYFIDGVSVSSGATSTNAPTGNMGPGAACIKSATAGGAPLVLIDGTNGYVSWDAARYANSIFP
jgi:hypothetical protein